MNKKKWILVAIVLFSAIVVGLATSYAIFVINVTKDTIFKVVIGNLELSITPADTEDKIIMNRLVPTRDRDALKENGYEFTIENTGNIDSYYTVYLDDLFLNKEELEELLDESLTDEKTKRLEDSWVKMDLLEQATDKHTTYYMSDFEDSDHRVLATGFLKTGESVTYTLRMWVAFEVGNEAEDRYYATQIRVVGEQENLYVKKPLPVLKSRSDTEFWQYSDQITHIVVQDKLSPILGDQIVSWDVSDSSDSGTVMAYYDPSNTTLYIQGKGGVALNPDSSSLFKNFTKLLDITGVDLLDASQVTTLKEAFSHCDSLTDLNLSGWDTSLVENMDNVFSHSGFVNLNLENWNVSNADTMAYLFYDCKALQQLNVNNWQFGKLKNMGYMFYHCDTITQIDLSSWKISTVTNLAYLFCDCKQLTDLKLGEWDTSQVTSMMRTFANCQSLRELDIESWDTSGVNNINYMFYYCYYLTTTINFKSTKCTYDHAFDEAASRGGAEIIINYTAQNYDLVQEMVGGTKKLGQEIPA